MAARSRIPDRGAFLRGPLRHCFRQGPGSHPFSGWTRRQVLLLCEWRPPAVSPAFNPFCFVVVPPPTPPVAPPFSVRSCRCGRTIDIFGHHCAACARAGVLGRRGFAMARRLEVGSPPTLSCRHGPHGACHGQQTSGSCG